MFYFGNHFGKEFKSKNESYADHQQPYVMVDESTVVNKNTVMMSIFTYNGDDLDLVYIREKIDLSKQLNRIALNLGDEWAISFENSRIKYNAFEQDPNFSNSIAKAFDADRMCEIKKNPFFQSYKYICIFYQPKNEKGLVNKFLFTNRKDDNLSLNNEIDFFKKKIDMIRRDFERVFLSVGILKNEELLEYLHFTATLKTHPIAMPTVPIDLDILISNIDVNVDYPIRIGKNYILNATISDFPTETKIDMLRILDSLKIQYRQVSRFIPMAKEKALSKIKSRRDKFASKLQGVQLNKEEAPKFNTEHLPNLEDANNALSLVGHDICCFGDLTSTIQVFGEVYEEVEENFAKVINVIQSIFPVREENIHTWQCWLSSLPGNFFANCRKTFINSVNLSHIISTHSAWSGELSNKHLKKITGNPHPHMIVSGDDGGVFFLNLNFKDVGHTFIAGQTGSGKSTLLCALEIQFLRYKNAQIFIFDKDKSSYHLTKEVGGTFYEPSSEGEGSIVFQPFDIEDDEFSISWASGWVVEVLILNNFVPTPRQEEEITTVIKSLVDLPRDHRTISTFIVLCQIPEVKEIFTKYSRRGRFGYIFDGDNATMDDNFWLTFEMDKLVKLGDDVLLPALSYLFYQVDQRLVAEGDPSLIVLDEAWLFLKNPIFKNKIIEWLKTLRKKNTYVIICTQEIVDVTGDKDLVDVVIGSCQTKIFLANPSAISIAESYRKFGLTEIEIHRISKMVIQREYLFKNPIGTRIFDMELTPKQLNILIKLKNSRGEENDECFG